MKETEYVLEHMSGLFQLIKLMPLYKQAVALYRLENYSGSDV